jgi:hypothetical protein
MTTKFILKLVFLGLFAAAVANPQAQLHAQTTNKAAAKKTATASTDAKSAKKASPVPFNGKLAKLDKVGKTLTVGKRTFRVTSETKINKGGKPATFEDGVEGEAVTGSIKQAEDGNWVALTVNYGPKTAAPKTTAPKAADKKAAPKQ